MSVSNNLGNLSENKDNLRSKILEFSANVKNYAKWFEIAEISKNEQSYTLYKIVYRFLPKELNETIKEITVWKRFRDFRNLNQTLFEYHNSLHRKDKFPEFVRTVKYFGRFDDKIIEERQKCCLRLLQFIGSQSHLYRHEKFIEFLLEGTFKDYSFVNQNENILLPKPTLSSIEQVKKTEPSFNESIETLKSDLSKMIDDELENEEYEQISIFLNKSLRYIDSAMKNQNLNYHFASFKLLKSAANTLDNFLSDIDQNTNNILNLKKKSALRKLINKLNKHAEQIQSTNLLDLDDIIGDSSDKSARESFSLKNNDKIFEKKNSESILNDWILSEFNLNSKDFNSELDLISANLFDLNFSYKICKVLNFNCFLLQERPVATSTSQNSNLKKFVLKRLKKSSCPSLSTNSSSIVPLISNRIPFMCQLIKYYESENTIFLLIELIEYGRLFQHLESLYQLGDLFLKNLADNERNLNYNEINNLNNSAGRNSNSSINRLLNRRRSLTFSSTSLEKCLASVNSKSSPTSKRRSQSVRSDLLDSKKTENLNKFTEVNLDKFKLTDENNDEIVISSSQSEESSDSNFFLSKTKENDGNSVQKSEKLKKYIKFEASSNSVNDLNETKTNKSNWPLNVFSNSFKLFTTNSAQKPSTKKISRIHYVNDFNINQENENQTSSNKIFFTVTPFLKQAREWLAQLSITLKKLHEIGLLIKDLRPDNLLLNKNGTLVLTYISKWNLVDEKLNNDAVQHFYAAPELCGLVNYIACEMSDYWSFGVIAYELLTRTKFSDYNSACQIYANNIIFPQDFNNEIAKDLITKILCVCPTKRITKEQIQNHDFFSGIDFNEIENLYFKS